MKKGFLISVLLSSALYSSSFEIGSNISGVLIEQLKTKQIQYGSEKSSIELEIDLAKKDTLSKIERDAAKELADFTERKNDLEFFKEKYSSNMYAKNALARLEQEEKDLVFMHDKYMKNKTEKIKQLMDENYIPDEVMSKGKRLLSIKKKITKIKATLKYNVAKYHDAVKIAKDELKKSNELLLKELAL